MAKVVVRRTREQKEAAKKRFESRVVARVERVMYLEGQAVPLASKTPLVQKMRTRTPSAE